MSYVTVLPKFKHAFKSSGRLVKHTDCSDASTEFDSVGLEWYLRISISNKIPGDTDAAGLEITL